MCVRAYTLYGLHIYSEIANRTFCGWFCFVNWNHELEQPHENYNVKKTNPYIHEWFLLIRYEFCFPPESEKKTRVENWKKKNANVNVVTVIRLIHEKVHMFSFDCM